MSGLRMQGANVFDKSVFVVVMLATYQMPTIQIRKKRIKVCDFDSYNSKTCYIRCETWFLSFETRKQTLNLIGLFFLDHLGKPNVQSLKSIYKMSKTWLDFGLHKKWMTKIADIVQICTTYSQNTFANNI